MHDSRNWRFPDLGRELAIIGAAMLTVAAGVGAAVAFIVDKIVYRHRRRQRTPLHRASHRH